MTERRKSDEARKILLDPGKTVQIFHPQGIIEVRTGQKLDDFTVETFPFTTQEVVRERVIGAMLKAVSRVVEQFKTEVGSLATDPEKSFDAGVWRFLEEGPLQRVFLSAVRLGIDPGEINEMVKNHILLAGGFPEKHMGIPHDSARVLIDQLGEIVNYVVENQEEVEAKYSKQKSSR